MVKILEERKEEPEDYYLLGPVELELDLFPLVVTYHSPFGQALIGKKVNEDFTLDIRGKEIKFKVIEIQFRGCHQNYFVFNDCKMV